MERLNLRKSIKEAIAATLDSLVPDFWFQRYYCDNPNITKRPAYLRLDIHIADEDGYINHPLDKGQLIHISEELEKIIGVETDVVTIGTHNDVYLYWVDEYAVKVTEILEEDIHRALLKERRIHGSSIGTKDKNP